MCANIIWIPNEMREPSRTTSSQERSLKVPERSWKYLQARVDIEPAKPIINLDTIPWTRRKNTAELLISRMKKGPTWKDQQECDRHWARQAQLEEVFFGRRLSWRSLGVRIENPASRIICRASITITLISPSIRRTAEWLVNWFISSDCR